MHHFSLFKKPKKTQKDSCLRKQLAMYMSNSSSLGLFLTNTYLVLCKT